MVLLNSHFSKVKQLRRKLECPPINSAVDSIHSAKPYSSAILSMKLSHVITPKGCSLPPETVWTEHVRGSQTDKGLKTTSCSWVTLTWFSNFPQPQSPWLSMVRVKVVVANLYQVLAARCHVRYLT